MGQPLSYAQLKGLWLQAGGSPKIADTMAAVALAESGGRTDALNPNGATGDYSVGPWQINYYGNLRPGRTARYGTPEQLLANPLLDAKAAVDLAGTGGGLGNWSTYNHGTYQRYLNGSTPAAQSPALSPAAAGLSGPAPVAQPAVAAALAQARRPQLPSPLAQALKLLGFGGAFPGLR